MRGNFQGMSMEHHDIVSGSISSISSLNILRL